MKQETVYVGIDVSKTCVDVAVRPTGQKWTISNDESGIGELVSRLKALDPVIVVLESTGGLELPSVTALAAGALPVVIVNPRQVRDFARATGTLAKTDALDAAVLAHFADAVRPAVRPLRDAETQVLSSLVARRHQVVSIVVAEKNRLGSAIVAVRPRIEAHIAWLEQELSDIDEGLRQTLRSSPVWRVPVVLRALTGVELSQSAITQDALRRARGAVGDAYQRLRESVRESAVVHTDDTGWRVGGEGAFLMAFETDDAPVYQVRGRHRNEEVREVVPGDYAGVMVTDRARSYDARALSGVRQQKCLAHVLRSISEVVQTKVGRGRTPDRSRGHGFGKRLSELLREAMELRESERRGEMADYAGEKERLRREVSHHLRDRPMPDRDNLRLQNELGWQDDRGNLLRFLDGVGIEPTNNRAERALRGAVIARKVSHCSRNEAGADAFSAFTSVIRTLYRNGGGQPVVDGLCGVFSAEPVHARSI